MTTQNETVKLIQGSVSGPEETKELQEKDEDNQNFHPTSGKEDQVQGSRGHLFILPHFARPPLTPCRFPCWLTMSARPVSMS